MIRCEKSVFVPSLADECFCTLKRCAAVLIFTFVTAVFSCTLAFAADQQPNLNACGVSPEEWAGLNQDLSTNVLAGKHYGETILRMLKNGEYDQIECLADHARSGKERFSGGAWKLWTFYGAVSSPVVSPMHATEEDWKDLFSNLDAWVAHSPKSITAQVTLASAYLSYGYDARGTGRASTVTENGWKLFAERTEKAWEILEKARALGKCPQWYVAMLSVAENQQWDADRRKALFEEAFRYEPGYYYYARMRAYDLLPKWEGEPGDTEKFSDEIANRVGGDEGDILYFEIATADYLICDCPTDDPNLSWERIVQGFRLSEKKYGVSMMSLNRIAYLSSFYKGWGDAILEKETLDRIGDQWDVGTWHSQENFEEAKKTAANNAPIMAARLAIENAADEDMKTPDGPRLQAAFEMQLKDMLRQCEPASTDTGIFKTLIKVGEKGTVEDMRVYWRSAASHCFYEKLVGMKESHATPFPAPPKAPFWIRFDTDWAEAKTVAAK